MKLSVAWLRTFIDTGLTNAELFERLTMAGLPVDAVEDVAPPCSGVVVADVRTVARHPSGEKLSICQVFDGEREQTVVSGAPNVRAGMKSAFARIGAKLPGDVTIAAAKRRGVESFGMLCSGEELGIGDAGGILDLAATTRTGLDIRAALALDDVAIELELTPNRGDWLSVLGIARELSVLLGKPLRAPAPQPVEVRDADRFPVTLEDPAGCPKYLGRIIRGIDPTRASPLWLTERLRRAGLRAIDPAVDVTNYVMLELGQPLHAFDLSRLSGGIVVRRARAGERLTLLDERSLDLDPSALLIADAKGPVALAGVMGGSRSGIGTGTRNVFLECAFFTPSVIGATARRYATQTDASQRFERGVDPRLQHDAIERATELMLDIIGGDAGPLTEAEVPSSLPVVRRVSLRHRRLNRLVGDELPAAEVESILTRVGAGRVEQSTRDGDVTWVVEAPSHRFDLNREEDLVEEVCRVRGYGSFPARMPAARLALTAAPRERTPRERIKHLFADLGYQEVITYSFIDPRHQDLLDPEATAVRLTNPMSQDQSVMRTNLLPGLLGAVAANSARQQMRVRVFELGRCFTVGKTLEQRWMLGGALWGDSAPESWSDKTHPVDFFDAKGDVERLFALTRQRQVGFEPLADPLLHPGQAAAIRIDGEVVGRIGRLHPELEQRLDLKSGVFLFEIDAERASIGTFPRYTGVSRFPSVRRDLSLQVGANVPAAQVESVLKSALGNVLTEFRIFDVYRGEGVDSQEKRIAVGLTFQDPSRTLTDADISGLVDAAIGALEKELGARLR